MNEMTLHTALIANATDYATNGSGIRTRGRKSISQLVYHAFDTFIYEIVPLGGVTGRAGFTKGIESCVKCFVISFSIIDLPLRQIIGNATERPGQSEHIIPPDKVLSGNRVFYPVEGGYDCLISFVPGNALKIVALLGADPFHGILKVVFGIDNLRGVLAAAANHSQGMTAILPDIHQLTINQLHFHPASGRTATAESFLPFLSNFFCRYVYAKPFLS
jgi:hypothetical protein